MSRSLSRLERSGDFAAQAPLLAAAPRSPRVCADVLRAAVPQLALGLWRLDSLDVGSSWRHKETVLVTTTAVITDCAAGTTRQLALLLKADPKNGGWHADQASRALRPAGLDGPAAAIMRTYGVHEDGTLVCQNVAGRVWKVLLGGLRGLRCAKQVARFIHTMQTSNAALPDGPDLLPETTRELTELAWLAGNNPTLQRQIEELAERLIPALDPALPLPRVPGHGDLHPRNVVFGSRDTSDANGELPLTAVDLDHAGRHEPALDVGYAIAHLIVRARRAGMSPERGSRIAATLWDEYRAAGGRATDERVAIQAARSLTQVLHYELIGMGGGRLDTLPIWSTLALLLLDKGRAALGPPT